MKRPTCDLQDTEKRSLSPSALSDICSSVLLALGRGGLTAAISSTLPSFPEASLDCMVEKLIEGVETEEDLQYVRERNIEEFMRPIQCRKRLEAWRRKGPMTDPTDHWMLSTEKEVLCEGNSFVDGLAVLFSCYYNFNLQYRPDAAGTLEFIQSAATERLLSHNRARPLHVTDCRQCYDGASVMSGVRGGVQALHQKQLARYVPYSHCYNHQLHLVVVHGMQSELCAQRFFDLVRSLHKFFQHHHMSQKYEILKGCLKSDGQATMR
ncbi:uncharacterized protein V6R79_019711 [Siganus canaliculatus]